MIAFRCVRKKNRSRLRYYDVLSASCVSQILAAMREGGDFLRSELGAVATRFGGMLIPGDGNCRTSRIRIPGISA
jgi:hypothetical protein